MTYSKFYFGAEPVPAKFKSKGAGVRSIKGKWPAPDLESELRSFETLSGAGVIKT